MPSLNSPPPLFPSPDHDDEGLISCTETLGFESSNDTGKATAAYVVVNSVSTVNHETSPFKPKKTPEKKSEFPPPMSSLNPDGKRVFYLCPVRCQGRLELTEVKIQRTEFLHASRENGRLRLDLVETEDQYDDDEEEEVEEEECNNEEEVEGGDDEDRNWLLPAVICGGGDGGLRRCNEAVNRRHRQELQRWWGPQCVISSR